MYRRAPVLKSIFIDFNAYFASVEQQLQPQLRGKPIAIVPVKALTTFALAASYEAKAYGVTTGTRIGDALVRCPQLILVQARHTEYIRMHHALVDCVNTVIPVKRVMSIDEMVCDLMGGQREPDQARRLANHIKETIHTTVGVALNCSIGIGPNDYLAKTASDMQKPNGLVVIEQHQLPEILYSLNLNDLVGIGKQMLVRLHRHSIYTVEQLFAASEKKLRTVWGGIEGERMYARIRGANVPLAATHKSSISHEHVLEPSLRTVAGASGVIHRLLQKAATRLRSYAMVTAQVTITIKHTTGVKWKKRTHIAPTNDSLHLTQLMSDILGEWTASYTQVPMKVSVELTKLSIADSVPIPLFNTNGPARTKLNESLDHLNSKFGKNTIYVGSAWNGLEGSSTHIAFNHIPQQDDADGTER
ncbi:MAG: DNA polymerase [Chlorobi bacterium]|nr:MAG: DNA polymerase [Bacteroidota bacterium]MBL1161232.1 DNA polymerase [Chlorobiota bacterium]